MIVIQKRKEFVILLLLERIVFVIVALGNTESSAPARPCQCIPSDSKHLIHPELLGSMPPSSFTIEFRRNPVATIWSCVGCGQLIAGNLLNDNLIVRLFLIERVDDVIAIEINVARFVLFKPIRVGVARCIEPMPAPAPSP